jgi:glycosyltransferase involved in cell wall biosynthesis
MGLPRGGTERKKGGHTNFVQGPDLRILQIIPSLDQAGAEKQMVLLATGLARPEFDVHVCALTRLGPLAEPLREGGIAVESIEKRWKVDPAAYYRLRRLIQRLQPDLVHTWIFAANSYGRQAALGAGVKHVLAGERCVDRWKAWHELAIDRHLARKTDWIVTNSSGVRDFYVEHGLPREKFVIIPNGIRVADIPAAMGQGGATPGSSRSAERQQLLEELRLPAHARLIGAVGRLWPQKRYKDLIWAADLLKVIRDDTYLLVVGEGPERERLERFREEVQIEDRVRLLGHRPDVPRILRQLDCFWLGSGYEGQSNSLMEAMATGIPVIATNIPGNQDLIEQGVSGFLVAVGDRAGFARWTNTLLDDQPLARKIAAAARDRMASQFSVERMVERYSDLYRQTLQAQRLPSHVE